jgi:PAS domain S-box-containing protein
MAGKELSPRACELSRRIEEIKTQCITDPANAAEKLLKTLSELQIGLEELSAADEELRQKNELLLEAQERLKTAIDFTFDWETWLGPDGSYIYVSPSCERITGYAAEEFLLDPELIGKIVHPEDRMLFPRHFNESDEQIGSVDFRIIALNGDVRWISHVCQPVFSSDGRFLGRRGSSRDITERVRAEEALREAKEHLETRVRERTVELEKTNARLQREMAERTAAQRAVESERERFNEILETLPAYLVLLTPDYHVSFANRFFRERFGESHGRRCFEYLFGRSEPCEICETYKVLQTMKPHRWEWRGPDGRSYDIYDYPFTDADGSPLIMEMGIDITERKQAEDELKAASKYNRSLLEANLDPLVTIGPDGTITDVNTATVAVTGYSREELIGTDFSDYFTEPYKARAGYKKAFEEGLVRDSPLEIQHRYGRITPVLYNASVYRDDGGNVMGVFAAARDITERRQAEEALRKASEYNRSLIEASLDPLVTISPEGKITDVNAATEAVTGYSREELIGTNFLDYFTEPEKARAGYRQVFDEGSVQDYALEIRHRNGQITPVLYNASVYRDNAGNVLGIFAAARDVTERRRAEIELRKHQEHLEELVRERTRKLETSESLLRNYFDSPGVMRGVVDVIADDDVLHIADNEVTAGFLNLTPEKMRNKRGSELGEPPEALRTWVGHYMQSLRTGRPVNFEYCDARGGNAWLSATVSYLGTNQEGLPRFTYVITDITQRKKAEEALQEAKEELEVVAEELRQQNDELLRTQLELQESEENYRDLVQNANSIILKFGLDGKISFFNEYAQRFFGYSEEEILGRDVKVLVPKTQSDGKSLENLAENILEHPEDFADNVNENVLKTGERVWISWRNKAIKDSEGMIIGNQAIGQDITTRKRAENELNKAREDLELEVQKRTAELSASKEELQVINEELQTEIVLHQKLEAELIVAKERSEAAAAAKSAFLANMSHELRTPMNAVIGFTSLLLDESLPSEHKEFVESIRDGGEAMMAVINELLEFSRTDKEKIELEQRPFSLTHCIESSLDMVASQAKQKGLSLSYTISYGTPDGIIGDHGRLRQILVNLLGNAVKFTDDGGVSVTVSSRPIEANKHRILFSVKDTGTGIPPDAMDSIFEPFTQVERILSLKRDGVGLGLAISKKLVELMGGEIWAENDPDQGAILNFTIQAEITQAKRQELGEPREAMLDQDLSKLRPMSILVAEDNPSNQKVLVQMLERLGYRPDAVSNGKEVIQALKRRPFDLIFMDVKMPEMDGITATKVIRTVWPETGPKIIAITAYALEGDRELCLEAGMDGYIAKPVMARDLVEALKMHQPSEDSQRREEAT